MAIYCMVDYGKNAQNLDNKWHWKCVAKNVMTMLGVKNNRVK